MKNKNTINRIKKTNKFWLIWIYVAAPVGVIGTILSIVEQNAFPEKSANYSIGYSFIILIFTLLVTLLYYIQYKIFDFNLSNIDLRTALQKAISRFRDFYKVSTGIYLIFFPFVFFVLIDILSNINLTITLWLSLAISAVALWINHVYYKKTYFKWIENMESNLDELKEFQ